MPAQNSLPGNGLYLTKNIASPNSPRQTPEKGSGTNRGIHSNGIHISLAFPTRGAYSHLTRRANAKYASPYIFGHEWQDARDIDSNSKELSPGPDVAGYAG